MATSRRKPLAQGAAGWTSSGQESTFEQCIRNGIGQEPYLVNACYDACLPHGGHDGWFDHIFLDLDFRARGPFGSPRGHIEPNSAVDIASGCAGVAFTFPDILSTTKSSRIHHPDLSHLPSSLVPRNHPHRATNNGRRLRHLQLRRRRKRPVVTAVAVLALAAAVSRGLLGKGKEEKHRPAHTPAYRALAGYLRVRTALRTRTKPCSKS